MPVLINLNFATAAGTGGALQVSDGEPLLGDEITPSGSNQVSDLVVPANVRNRLIWTIENVTTDGIFLRFYQSDASPAPTALTGVKRRYVGPGEVQAYGAKPGQRVAIANA